MRKKKRSRRLQLHRETLRALTGAELSGVFGGRTGSTCENSCDAAVTRPASLCNSCHQTCNTCHEGFCEYNQLGC